MVINYNLSFKGKSQMGTLNTIIVTNSSDHLITGSQKYQIKIEKKNSNFKIEK